METEKLIFEAFTILAGAMPYRDISITAIAKKAGIARQTFYRKKIRKDDITKKMVNFAYKTGIISIKVEPAAIESVVGSLKVVITLDHKFHDENHRLYKNILEDIAVRDWILRDLEKRVLDYSKEYFEKITPEKRQMCRFRIYNQIGGWFNALCRWYQENMPFSLESFVHIFNIAPQPGEETETALHLELQLK